MFTSAAKPFAEKLGHLRPAPKGASDWEELMVSLKRYPDTKPEFAGSGPGGDARRSIDDLGYCLSLLLSLLLLLSSVSFCFTPSLRACSCISESSCWAASIAFCYASTSLL
jgi:hypothetical protein